MEGAEELGRSSRDDVGPLFAQPAAEAEIMNEIKSRVRSATPSLGAMKVLTRTTRIPSISSILRQ